MVSSDTMTGADSDEKVITLLQTIESRMPSDLHLKPSAQVLPARHLPGNRAVSTRVVTPSTPRMRR